MGSVGGASAVVVFEAMEEAAMAGAGEKGWRTVVVALVQ